MGVKPTRGDSLLEYCSLKTYFTAAIIFTLIAILLIWTFVTTDYFRPLYLHRISYQILRSNRTVSSVSTTIIPLEEEATYSTFNSGPSFNPFFTDFLPRSAYFDSRPRDGHDNATVILVQALKTVFEENRVIACEVDEVFNTTNFQFNVLGVFKTYVHKHVSSLTHDQAMLTCYDLPVQQGSRVFVLYKHKNGTILKIETERRLYFPVNVSTSHSRVFKSQTSFIMVCVTMFGKPPWLREWLVYQKTIGVDFIHIYAQESFITEGSVNNSVLQSYLKSGYAKLDVWKAYLTTNQDYYYQQPLLYVDCIYRYRTEFDYALVYDTDDFFVPRIPGETDIHYYAKRFFHEEMIASVSFNWIEYFPDCGLTERPEAIKDGNVTEYISFYYHYLRYLKSMYKLSGVVEIRIHNVVKFIPGYTKYGAGKIATTGTAPVSTDIAYVAHIRKNKTPKKKILQLECKKHQTEDGVYTDL